MSEALTGGVMPPEPPPPSGEADYGGGGRRNQALAAAAPGAAGVPATPGVYGTELAVPSYLLNLPSTPALNAAVSKVIDSQRDSGKRVPKRGHNKWHDYKYATADDLREHVASMIGMHGLSYTQHEVGYSPFQSMLGVHFFFILSHESGEHGPPERVTVLSRLIDNKGQLDDKALSKAWTLALKDWSKSRFSIATGDLLDDPDANFDRQDERQAQQRQPAPTQRQPAQRANSKGNATPAGKPVQQSDGAPSYQPQGAGPAFAPDEPTPFIFETLKEGRRDLRDADTWTNEWRKRVNGTRKINAPDKLHAARKMNTPHIAAVAAVDAAAAAYVTRIIAEALVAMGDDTRSPPAKPAENAKAGPESVDLPTEEVTPDAWALGMLEVIKRCTSLDDLKAVQNDELRGSLYEAITVEQAGALHLAIEFREVALTIAKAVLRSQVDHVMQAATTIGEGGLAPLRDRLNSGDWNILTASARAKWEMLPEDMPAEHQESKAANEASVPSLEDEQWIGALLNEIGHAQSEPLVRAWRSQAARKARFNRITKEHPEITERVDAAEADRIAAIAARRAA